MKPLNDRPGRPEDESLPGTGQRNAIGQLPRQEQIEVIQQNELRRRSVVTTLQLRSGSRTRGCVFCTATETQAHWSRRFLLSFSQRSGVKWVQVGGYTHIVLSKVTTQRLSQFWKLFPGSSQNTHRAWLLGHSFSFNVTSSEDATNDKRVWSVLCGCCIQRVEIKSKMETVALWVCGNW